MDIQTMDRFGKNLNSLIEMSKNVADQDGSIWIKNYAGNIKKYVFLEEENIEDVYRLCIAVKNIVFYYKLIIAASPEEFTVEASRRALVSFYLCCVQTSKEFIDEKFEQSKLFSEVVEIEDWAKVTDRELLCADMAIQQRLLSYYINGGEIRPEETLMLHSALTIRAIVEIAATNGNEE